MGAIAGSFIGAWTWRWPRGQSIVHGRSRCDHCQRILTPAELIPLVSYWMLGRRCSTCNATIDRRQFDIELACACLGGLVFFLAPLPVAIGGAVFGWLLLALAVVDMTHLKLPDPMTATLAVAGLVSGFMIPVPLPFDRMIGGLAGFLSLWLIASLYRFWRGRDGMGGGDAKMLGAIGCWLGWQELPLVLLAASLFGLSLVAFDLARGRVVNATSRLPFGSLLAASAFSIWLMRNGNPVLPAL